MVPIIRNFIAKALFKKKGAIANNKSVDFSTKALEQRLKNLGIDPNAIKNENELNQILSYVKKVEDQAFNQRFGNMLGGSKFDTAADVLDMTGKKIDPRSKIMGGKQAETEAQILARIKSENKLAAKRLKEKKEDADDLDFAEGGRIGLKDGVLKRGLKSITGTDTYKTLEDRGFNTAVTLDLAFNEIFNLLSGIPGLAEGGRIGYKDGPKDPRRRGFMKAAVGIASMLPFGIGKGVKMAAPVVAKAAEITGPALAKIVETVMSAGKLISVQGKRVKNMVTKKKLKNVEVEEDIADGSYIIKKDNKEIYYKPGRMDETGGIEDDIIEVIDKTIKKASGGVASMLGE